MSQGSGRTATRCRVCSLGGTNPSRLTSRGEVVAGDILLIRPGIEHTVICSGGINVMYLDGLQWSGSSRLAERLQGRLANLAIDAIFQGSDAQTALRQRLVSGATQFPPQLVAVIEDLITEPMSRMTQRELADRLQMERTRALRMFKAATGQTFRRFKQWSGLQHAARKSLRANSSERQPWMEALPTQPISPGRFACLLDLHRQRRSPDLRKLHPNSRHPLSRPHDDPRRPSRRNRAFAADRKRRRRTLCARWTAADSCHAAGQHRLAGARTARRQAVGRDLALEPRRRLRADEVPRRHRLARPALGAGPLARARPRRGVDRSHCPARRAHSATIRSICRPISTCRGTHPFYGRRGFSAVPRGAWPRAFRRQFMIENSHGHPPWRRTIMQRRV